VSLGLLTVWGEGLAENVNTVI